MCGLDTCGFVGLCGGLLAVLVVVGCCGDWFVLRWFVLSVCCCQTFACCVF